MRSSLVKNCKSHSAQDISLARLFRVLTDAAVVRLIKTAVVHLPVARGWRKSARHLPFHPLHRSAATANDPRDLEDAMTGIEVLADGFLDLQANGRAPTHTASC